MQLGRDCLPTNCWKASVCKVNILGQGGLGLAPLKMFLFNLVPVTLLLLPLAPANQFVSGICYQHSKTYLLVQGADLHPFHCQGPEPTPPIEHSWAGRKGPCSGMATPSATDMLLTTIKHSSIDSTCSLTSFTAGSSLCLWCSRQAGSLSQQPLELLGPPLFL